MSEARLIDANALFDQIRLQANRSSLGETRTPEISGLEVISLIKEAPTIDAEPVRHGRWIVQKVDDIRTKFYCSECERCVWCGNFYFMKPTKYVSHVYPYCHCGAKMDGGEDDA